MSKGSQRIKVGNLKAQLIVFRLLSDSLDILREMKFVHLSRMHCILVNCNLTEAVEFIRNIIIFNCFPLPHSFRVDNPTKIIRSSL